MAVGDGTDVGCEQSEALLQEMTALRQENEELQFRANELECQVN